MRDETHRIDDLHAIVVVGGLYYQGAQFILGQSRVDLDGDGVQAEHIGHGPAQTAGAPVDIGRTAHGGCCRAPGGGDKY